MNRFLFASALSLCVLVPSVAHAATVTLSISDARLVEPPSGQKSMIFPVTLSNVWSDDVRVTYKTSVGPNANSVDSNTLAQSGLDFSARQGQLIIPSGNLTAQIEIPILADNAVEKDETFAVTLSGLQGTDNSGATVVLNPKKTVAKGTIVEPVKGIVLGGQVASYIVNPYQSSYNPATGQFGDFFDTPAIKVVQSGISLTITSTSTTQSFSTTATTDSQGNFAALVRPGTYSVKIGDFARQNSTGNYVTYSYPARTVSLSRDSRLNDFFFYGIAGTLGVPSTTSTSRLNSVYLKVDARPVGADPSSAPVASDTADDSDPIKNSRGYRFFIPGLPPGSYTLSFSNPGSSSTSFDYYGYYTRYYDFPTVTVTLPVTTGVNRPVAHVEIAGTLKTSSSTSARSSKSPSAGGS